MIFSNIFLLATSSELELEEEEEVVELEEEEVVEDMYRALLNWPRRPCLLPWGRTHLLNCTTNMAMVIAVLTLGLLLACTCITIVDSCI